MKKITFSIFALGLCAVALSSCDSKNEPIDNMIYINEAATEPSTDIAMGDAGQVTTTSITIAMAQKAVAPVKVKIALDPEGLDLYNRRNETEYALVPEQYISFPAEVEIPAGSSQVNVPVTVTSFDDPGTEYAAAFKIVSADGMAISSGSNAFVIVMGKLLHQMAPGFISANAMTMDWNEEIELNNLTLEWWARVTTQDHADRGFTLNNQALFAFQANNELYVRFGDVVYADADGNNLYNFLQIKTLGIDANYDSGDPNERPLNPGEWIHFAHTFDGATGDVKLYMNGVMVNSKNGGAGKNFKMTGLDICAAGSYHADVIQLAQVRLWKTTRSANQILKNYKKAVKYDDPDLVFYLPMDEGTGSLLNDVTGHGHNVTIGSHSGNGSNANAYSWSEVTFE